MKLFNQSSKIVVTGGSGFLGSHLLNNAAFKNALAIGRTAPLNHYNFKKILFEDDNNLDEVFIDKKVVVHLAAMVNIMNDISPNTIDSFQQVNKAATLNLAKHAAIAGVKRFIFISTIKVLGEKTEHGQAFRYDDPYNANDPYSVSKAEAEAELKLIGDAYNMEIVIIRPPLVYGKGVKGNFASLIKLAQLPIPLPLASIRNNRSFVSVDNLVDLIVTCLNHPNAGNKTFLVSDDDDMSTPLLFSRLCQAGGYRSKIFFLPVCILYICLKVFGKLKIYERLCGSMQVDIEYTKKQLDWKPPFKSKDSLRSCWQLKNFQDKGQQK